MHSTRSMSNGKSSQSTDGVWRPPARAPQADTAPNDHKAAAAAVKCGAAPATLKAPAMVGAPPRSLYDRLGGVFAIAAVVKRFSDRVLDNPVAGRDSPNAGLRTWSRDAAPTRLPGLNFMRTLWLCDVAGGPYKYVPTRPGTTVLGLEAAHCPLAVGGPEFDAVADELAATLDEFNVPAPERAEVLAAFAAHKPEVTLGRRVPQPAGCPFSQPRA